MGSGCLILFYVHLDQPGAETRPSPCHLKPLHRGTDEPTVLLVSLTLTGFDVKIVLVGGWSCVVCPREQSRQNRVAAANEKSILVDGRQGWRSRIAIGQSGVPVCSIGSGLAKLAILA